MKQLRDIVTWFTKKPKVWAIPLYYWQGFRDYYIPPFLWYVRPTPEDIQGVKSLEVNRICEECKKPHWSCYCFAEYEDAI